MYARSTALSSQSEMFMITSFGAVGYIIAYFDGESKTVIY